MSSPAPAAAFVSLRSLWKSSIFWAWALMGARILGNLGVVGYALHLFPQETVGTWYGMLSLVSGAVCIELGFSGTIGRFTSYYLAGARDVPALGLGRGVDGPAEPNLAALYGLLRVAASLYRILAILFLCIASALIAGWSMTMPDHPLAKVNPLAAACILVLGNAFNLMSYYWPTLLYSLHRVRLFYQCSLWGQLAGYAISMAGLWAGGGLAAMAVGQVAAPLLTRYLARRHVQSLLAQWGSCEPEALNWRSFWPMTWRTGVSQAASQLLLPMTPAIVGLYSLGLAASYGLGLQIVSLINGMSLPWLATQMPRISSLRAQNDFPTIRRIMKRRLSLSILTFVVMAVPVPWVLPWVLHLISSRTPFLGCGTWFLLVLASGQDLVVGAHVALMQAGNRVPYLTAFVATGLGGGLLAFLAGRVYGIEGMLFALVFSVLVYNAWWIPWTAWNQLRSDARS